MIKNANKTAIVFGIRNDMSISFEIAKKLKMSGANVIVTYAKENETDLKDLIKRESFDDGLSCALDVTVESDIKIFLDNVSKKFPQIDYILHGVAYASPQIISTTAFGKKDATEFDYLAMPFEDLVEAIDVSAYSLIRIIRNALPYLKPNSSVLTLTYLASNRVVPNYGGMAIAKSALENITMYLAESLGIKGIRVNAISAGLVMTSSAAGIKGIRKMREMSSHTAPLGNITAEDVANAALFYFSDLSMKNTGNVHYVDGGYNIMGIPD